MSQDLTVKLESLNFNQAIMFIWIHERRRHLKDIEHIDANLKTLSDKGVRLPDFTPEEFDAWIDI
jgi:hypothetical protein